MRRVFVDTSHWVAVLSPRERLHAVAIGWAESLSAIELVTTDAVLVETLAFFSGAGPTTRRQVVTFVTTLRASPITLILPQTRELFDAALDLYSNRLDKGYSLTDCMSMVVCAEYDITDVLTYDHHFEQEGLVALLRAERR